MKGVGVQQLTALITMKAMGIVPARDIVMLSTADEESSGERGIQWMLKNHLDEIDPNLFSMKAAPAAGTCSLRARLCSASESARSRSSGSDSARRARRLTDRSHPRQRQHDSACRDSEGDRRTNAKSHGRRCG
jgi:hypothetical protein